MKRKLIILLVIATCLFKASYSQVFRNYQTREIQVNQDTVKIDSLSIIPGSVMLKNNLGKIIDTSFYSVNYPHALLIIKNNGLKKKKLMVNYKIFPYYFPKKFFHKKPVVSDTIAKNQQFAYNYSPSKDDEGDMFDFEGLQKSGSISRGISFGNSQDLSVNSDLNLQLAGNLNNEIGIKAVISDNNIPIQPQGNTQQIQEFDKVFIELSKGSSVLTAGDFELHSKGSYFMNINKKAQGGDFSTSYSVIERDGKDDIIAHSKISGAISKGKYTKNTIEPIEGNQGPYRLKGANNETFIIVLAGSEKVYMDGKLLKRGENNDYVIDYNTAEITFTPQNMITKDKRIIVEFEYTDRNYARSMFYTENSIGTKKWDIRVNAYSEQDLKNQPLDMSLGEEEKDLLYDVGDSLQMAVSPFVDSVGYNNNKVLYKMTDTTVNGTYYDSIYVYSTNPDLAHYEVGFSLVGEGKGNYTRMQSAANGKVFSWIAPVNGIPQGKYEPVTLLVSPKKKQMAMVAADYHINKSTMATVEVAVSNNDINTFSPHGDQDNTGYALKTGIQNKTPVLATASNNWDLNSSVSHEWTNKLFLPAERYRNVEFERDWNVNDQNYNQDDHITTIGLKLADDKINHLGYGFSRFHKGKDYKAYKNKGGLYFALFNFHLDADGSILNTENLNHHTKFIRHREKLVKKLSWLHIGAANEGEDNRFFIPNEDTLFGNSYSFNEWQAFITNADTAVNRFEVKYANRIDNKVAMNTLKPSTKGESVHTYYEWLRNKNSRLKLDATYRKLMILDTMLTSNQPDENLVGRIEYFISQLDGAVSLNSFYEAGTGQEVKKEFSYLEVADGQGIYKWNDYNNNNVKELDEFDVAVYQDEADYIRVYIPTNEYIKTYFNRFNGVLNLDLSRVWRDEKGLKNFLSRFSDRSNYSIQQKTTNKDFHNAFNPFYSNLKDQALISYNAGLSNTLYFNKRSTKYSLSHTYRNTNYKSLLVNGFEARKRELHRGSLRWNISKTFTFKQEGEKGINSASSEYFNNRDYHIDQFHTKSRLVFQPSLYFRLGSDFLYGEKMNNEGTTGEKAIKRDVGIDAKFTAINKTNLTVKGNYIFLEYNAETNTPIAFEMLESLKPGRNLTWNLNIQRNLSGYLQLNLRYNGRKSPGNKTIHVGSVQLRAYF